jgi:hypothetical protein
VTTADGPNQENCFLNSSLESCENTEYGCCSDDVTPARGAFKEGCIDFSCRVIIHPIITLNREGRRGLVLISQNFAKASQFGCCNDLVTPAKRADLDGCPTDCSKSLYGCCPDGKSASRGTDYAGCVNGGAETQSDNNNNNNNSSSATSCSLTKHGCCDDGVTPAQGPDKENCPDYVIDLNEPVIITAFLLLLFTLAGRLFVSLKFYNLCMSKTKRLMKMKCLIVHR